MRRIVAGALIVGMLLAAVPVRAQIPVTDVAALVHLVMQVLDAKESLELMYEEYVTLQRMGRGLPGGMDRYRVPAIVSANHDVGRYPYAQRLLEGFNTGDPRGERYTAVMQRVDKPGTLFDSLTPEAKRTMEAAFAGIEITDSVATLGVHEAALARGYAGRIGTLIQHLEADVLNPGREFHEATTIADKIALGGLVNARQNQNSNQIASSILEQLLAKNMRMRNAAAAHSNMVITARRHREAISRSMFGDATTVLERWSLP